MKKILISPFVSFLTRSIKMFSSRANYFAHLPFEVQGLAAGAKIEVVDEARSLQPQPGAFADEFAPLAIHIYRIGQ